MHIQKGSLVRLAKLPDDFLKNKYSSWFTTIETLYNNQTIFEVTKFLLTQDGYNWMSTDQRYKSQPLNIPDIYLEVVYEI